MTKQNTKSAVNDIQSLLNPQGEHNFIKMWASMNERMTAIMVEAGTRSIDIVSKTSKEALLNLREVTQVRDEQADYGKAYSDFAQKQMDLLTRIAQDVGDVTQKAGTETTELASKAGEELSDKVAANTKVAAETLVANTKVAADKAGSAAEKTA